MTNLNLIYYIFDISNFVKENFKLFLIKSHFPYCLTNFFFCSNSALIISSLSFEVFFNNLFILFPLFSPEIKSDDSSSFSSPFSVSIMAYSSFKFLYPSLQWALPLPLPFLPPLSSMTSMTFFYRY